MRSVADESYDLNTSAGGVNDRADAKDAGIFVQLGIVGGSEFEPAACVERGHELFGNREDNVQRSFGGDPEEDVALLHFLSDAELASSDDAVEGSSDASLLKSEVGELKIRLRRISFGPVACDGCDGFIELVLDVLPVFFAADVLGAHDVGAAEVRLFGLLFGFPLVNLCFERGELCFLGFDGCEGDAVVELGEKLSLADAIADLRANCRDATIYLGGEVGLLFGYERTGSGVFGGIAFFWIDVRLWTIDVSRSRGGRRSGIGRSVCANIGMGVTPGEQSGEERGGQDRNAELQSAWGAGHCARAEMEVHRGYHPIQFHTVCHSQRKGVLNSATPTG